MTISFVVIAGFVLIGGFVDPQTVHAHAPTTGSASPALVAVILAFPVAMALATGTEAPATSIAQLGQLNDDGKRRFGQGTLALTIVIVGGMTMGLTILAVHLNVGIPGADETQISNLAKASAGRGLYSAPSRSRADCSCWRQRVRRFRPGQGCCAHSPEPGITACYLPPLARRIDITRQFGRLSYTPLLRR